MYNQTPEAGLASLVRSPYRDMDVMNVQMTPREVAGLQQIALAYGANEQDLYDPVTGQPRFSFLKKILPMLAGAVLGPAGFQLFSSALTAGLAVGAVTGLVEGDLKKGLMAGLGAYSGATLASGLKDAAAAAQTAKEKAAGDVLTKATSEKAASELGLDAASQTLSVPKFDLATGQIVGPVTPPPIDFTTGQIAKPFTLPTLQSPLGGGLPRVVEQAVATTPTFGTLMPTSFLNTAAATAPPTGLAALTGGAKALFTSPEARTAFGQALGGGFQSPLAQNISKFATFTGAMDALTPEPKEFKTEAGETIVYMPGERNPMYGMGQQYGYFLPGQYFKRTPQGQLVPYNPYQKPPGMAMGGPVQPDNDGYIDQMTGEETFADGGFVGVDPRSLVGDRLIQVDPRSVTVPPSPPDDRVYKPVQPTTVPVTPYSAPGTAADAVKRYEQMIYGPAPAPVNTQPVMDYLANLNKRAQRPLIYPYPGAGSGGGGGGGGNVSGGGSGGIGPSYGGGIGLGGGSVGAGIGGYPNPYSKINWTDFGKQIGDLMELTPEQRLARLEEQNRKAAEEAAKVKPDPKTTKLVDDALGGGVLNNFTDPNIYLPLAAGLLNPFLGLATYYGVQKGVIDTSKLPGSKTTIIAEPENVTPEAVESGVQVGNMNESSGGGGGGLDSGLGGPTNYMDRSLQNFIDQWNMDQMMNGRRGSVTVEELGMASGGPITAPNPYGGAVGEGYNFGFAKGGETEYAAAGKLLEGAGDGMSDDIPAVIRGKGVQRAALADGEFVIPADVVSHLGNGSTKAGAKKLHQMMARIRQARTGKSKQAPAVETDKYLPA